MLVLVVVVVNVVVVVAVLVGAGVVVVTRLKSAVGSAGYNGGVTPVSCSSSEARNFAIAVRARSGNGLDRVLAQCNSMRASCVSIFSTVFKSSSVSASNAAGFVCAGVVVVEMVAVVEVVVGVDVFCEASASRTTNAACILAIVF